MNPVNDAPMLDNSADIFLTVIDEDITDDKNVGESVSDILISMNGNLIVTDIDKDDPKGIAVIAVNNQNGIWQYKTDLEGFWTDFPSDISEYKALLLNDTAKIRFRPNTNFNGTVNPGITFRAWDMSDFEDSENADTSINGGITSFSENIGTIAIIVNPVTDHRSLPKVIMLLLKWMKTAAQRLSV